MITRNMLKHFKDGDKIDFTIQSHDTRQSIDVRYNNNYIKKMIKSRIIYLYIIDVNLMLDLNK